MNVIEFKNIDFNSKKIIDKYLKNNKTDISEYTFTNLIAWGDKTNIKYSEYNGGLLLLATQKVTKYFLPPIGYTNNEEIFDFLLDYGIKNKITNQIKLVPQSMIDKIDPDKYQIIEDPDNSDYIYLAEDLGNLKGRKYSNKRNFVKKFMENYDYQYVDYDVSMKKQCIELAERWFEKKNTDKYRCDECKAIGKFLDNYDNFNTLGKVFLIDGQVVAFTFGEELADDTFVIHFEKAETEFTGIYQAINKFFSSDILAQNYKYINREQDLGIDGIRKAKRSYLPVKMGKKYYIKTKNN